MRLRRAVLVVPMAAMALTAAAPAVGHAAPSRAAAAAKNANFKGKWKMSLGYTFTIKRENLKTGVCKGTQSYGNVYKLDHCKVHHHHFTFQIVAKSDGAFSDYHGKFKTHSLHGVWTPEGGGGERFTATRGKAK